MRAGGGGGGVVRGAITSRLCCNQYTVTCTADTVQPRTSEKVTSPGRRRVLVTGKRRARSGPASQQWRSGPSQAAALDPGAARVTRDSTVNTWHGFSSQIT